MPVVREVIAKVFRCTPVNSDQVEAFGCETVGASTKGELMNTRIKRNLWITILSAVWTIIGSMSGAPAHTGGSSASPMHCSPGDSQPCTGDTMTTTTPATGGAPGVFGGAATVTGAPVVTPVSANPSPSPASSPEPFDTLTAQQNALNTAIKEAEEAISKATNAAKQLEFQQRMDSLLQQLAELQKKIDQANQAGSPPSPIPVPTPPPTPSPAPSPAAANQHPDNSDFATVGDFLNPKSDHQSKQNIKNVLDAIDAKDDAQDALQKSGDAVQKGAEDLKKKLFGQ